MKRVAVIGFGFMGFVHAQNILKCEGLELAAIIDKDKAAVANKVENPDGNFSTGETDVEVLKQVPVYESLDKCMEEQDLDAVHVCVHTNLHYPIAKEALNKGLHVLLEKPFVLCRHTKNWQNILIPMRMANYASYPCIVFPEFLYGANGKKNKRILAVPEEHCSI